ncbi:Beta-hexosaminidase 2 [Sesamum alatum]|uniref:beta-N-acetylhexosaminidase n=1 Tax=Sesamum alatum TaxID=300844 RepID=A0AAE1Y0L3_9LAMI|nr:Beta-hexosaminidase 2 [Sesamum alatum]
MVYSITLSCRISHQRLAQAHFTISSPPHRYLTPAVHCYLRQIPTEHHRPLVTPLLNLMGGPPLTTLTIIISDAAALLNHGVDESYSLTIPSVGAAAVLNAETPWGAMRGLEMFSQLVYAKPERVACGLYISDGPLFPHRGIMLDTARNYYGVEDLLRLIRAIDMNKLNIFHWHITKSYSFLLVVPSEPELAAKGAYREEMKYTAADVKRVVEYGMEHGVRVVPEIDMPEARKSTTYLTNQLQNLKGFRGRGVRRGWPIQGGT